MDSIKGWLSEIDKSVRALGGEGSLDIIVPPDAALSRTVALEGFPGVLPLWSGHLQTVGLLANPSTLPRAWPTVILSGGDALTLASDARTLLPQLIVHRVLSKLPDAARLLAKRWVEIEARVSTLHHVLGGNDESLTTAIAAVCDPATRELFTYRPGSQEDFEAAHSRLARQVDKTEPFLRYADWLDACVAGRWSAPETAERYGPWGRRVLCWACRLRYLQPAVLTLPTAWIYGVIEGHAGVDSGVPTRATWAARPGAASGETALVEAAQSIANEPPSGDPVADGLVKALRSEGTSYRGYAHAEAVVALDERGEPHRAWGALQSAAWWAARNTGQSPQAMLDGARLLAERHKWSDVQWVIERATKGA